MRGRVIGNLLSKWEKLHIFQCDHVFSAEFKTDMRPTLEIENDFRDAVSITEPKCLKNFNIIKQCYSLLILRKGNLIFQSSPKRGI